MAVTKRPILYGIKDHTSIRFPVRTEVTICHAPLTPHKPPLRYCVLYVTNRIMGTTLVLQSPAFLPQFTQRIRAGFVTANLPNREITKTQSASIQSQLNRIAYPSRQFAVIPLLKLKLSIRINCRQFQLIVDVHV